MANFCICSSSRQVFHFADDNIFKPPSTIDGRTQLRSFAVGALLLNDAMGVRISRQINDSGAVNDNQTVLLAMLFVASNFLPVNNTPCRRRLAGQG
jgi:hypothetical protein